VFLPLPQHDGDDGDGEQEEEGVGEADEVHDGGAVDGAVGLVGGVVEHH